MGKWVLVRLVALGHAVGRWWGLDSNPDWNGSEVVPPSWGGGVGSALWLHQGAPLPGRGCGAGM